MYLLARSMHSNVTCKSLPTWPFIVGTQQARRAGWLALFKRRDARSHQRLCFCGIFFKDRGARARDERMGYIIDERLSLALKLDSYQKLENGFSRVLFLAYRGLLSKYLSTV